MVSTIYIIFIIFLLYQCGSVYFASSKYCYQPSVVNNYAIKLFEENGMVVIERLHFCPVSTGGVERLAAVNKPCGILTQSKVIYGE